MKTTLTHEEVDILNTILPFIPYNEPFEIYALVAKVILKPKYTDETGKTDLSKYDPARLDYSKRGIFKNIDTYLMENHFVIWQGEHNGNSILKLTHRGEVLAAHGNIYSFIEAIQPSTENDIILRVPDIISQAFPHGEFAIEPTQPPIQIVNLNIYTPDESGELAKIKKALEPKERLKTMSKQAMLDEEVMQYLVKHGFAQNRHDIKQDGVIYRQLTDKGRKLKELGTIQKFHEYEKSEADSRYHQKMRDIYLFWIVLFGSVGTCISAYDDLLQSFEFYSHHSANWQYIAYFLTGFGLALLLWLLSWILRKTIGKLKRQA